MSYSLLPPEESSLAISIDVHDSEILEIEKVLYSLNDKVGGRHHLEGFRQEFIDRFAKIGFKVLVQVWETNVPEMFIFEADIIARDKEEFDLDRQVYEATHDILDLGEGGVIRTSKFKTDQKPEKSSKSTKKDSQTKD